MDADTITTEEAEFIVAALDIAYPADDDGCPAEKRAMADRISEKLVGER